MLRRRAEDNTTLHIFVTSVVYLIALTGCYRYGRDQHLQERRAHEEHLRGRWGIQQESEQRCQHSKRHAVELAEVLPLRVRHAALKEQDHDLEARAADCRARKGALEEAAAQLQEESAAEAERHAELRRKSKQLVLQKGSPKGMRALLLVSNVGELSKELAAKRAELGLPAVEMDEDFYAELVRKWKEKDPKAMTVGRSIKPLTEEEYLRAHKPLARYDKDRHAKQVFFPERLSDGQWRVPGWKGRFGTQELRYGTYVNEEYIPVTNINKQLRVLYNYALCAVGLNITSFMYPTMFKATPGGHTEYLHEYIETPIVLFCKDCIPQHHTPEFKLLCRRYTESRAYGTGLFWRARSRLRFKSLYMNMAEKWLEEHRFNPAESLAVRLPRSERYRDETCRDRNTTMCYEKVLKGTVMEVGASPEEQCFPPIERVAKLINRHLDGEGDTFKVYVSSEATAEEWNQLQALVSDPSKLHRRPVSHPMGTVDDIVDTFICALLQSVIVSRFEVKSTLIAEAYLLQHKLAPAGKMMVW